MCVSIGMSGLKQESSRERVSFMQERGKLNSVFYRIAMRPKKQVGHFHLGIAGQNFDPVGLTDSEKFKEAFYKYTGRKDIMFKKITAISYWKSV